MSFCSQGERGCLHARRGVGQHPGGSAQSPSPELKNRRYASYWYAFLFYLATRPEGIITTRCSDISPGKFVSSTKPTRGPENIIQESRTTNIPVRLSHIVEQMTQKSTTGSVDLLNMFKIRTTTESSLSTIKMTNVTVNNSTEKETTGENRSVDREATVESTVETTTQEIITSTTEVNLKVQTVSGCFGDIVHFHCDVSIVIKFSSRIVLSDVSCRSFFQYGIHLWEFLEESVLHKNHFSSEF